MSTFPLASNYRAVNPYVSRLLAGVGNQGRNFIGEAVLPSNGIVGMRAGDPGSEMSRMATGTIQRLGIDALFGDVNADVAINRKEGATFHRSKGFQLDPMTYSVRHFDGEAKISYERLTDIQLGSGADAEVKALSSAVEMATLKLALERYIAGIMFSETNWGTPTTVTNKWGASGDDPIRDLKNAKIEIEDYGISPNTLILGRTAADALMDSPGFREYMSFDSDRSFVDEPAIVGKLKAYFGIQNVHIGRAIYNSDADGTFTSANVWGDYVWMGHLDNGGMRLGSGDNVDVQLNPTAAGRIVVQDWRMEEYDEHQTRSRIMQIINRQWAGVVNAELGHLLKAVTA